MKKEEVNQVKITNTVVRSRCQKGKLLNQYLKIKKIGEGPFSKIKLMVDVQTEIPYAMKKYNLFILKKKIKMGAKLAGQTKYTTQANEVKNQIEIMKKLRHENIAVLHEILEDDEQEKVYLFMDYCEHGDLAEWDSKALVFKTKWSLKHIAKYFQEAAKGLEYMHSMNVVHRDIKPQNILITKSENAKLIDFGRSVQLNEPGQRLSGSQGTYHFMAPEMLSQKMPGGYDGKLCDIWSLGVSLFCCVFKCLPFYDPLLIKLFEKIQNCLYSIPANISEGQKKFIPLITKMIQADWNKRASLTEIQKQLARIEAEL